MGKFAKLISLKEAQVLLTVDYNDDEDNYTVNIRTDIKGLSFKVGIGGVESEDEALSVMNNYSLQEARSLRNNLESNWVSQQ